MYVVRGFWRSSLCLQHFAEADEGEAEEEQAGCAHVQQLWPEFVQVGATEDDALVVDGVLGARPVFADGARQLRHIAARGGRAGKEVHDDEQRQHQQAVLL